MKRVIKLCEVLLPAVLAVGLFWGAGLFVNRTMPPYDARAGVMNHNEKIRGLYLLKESAARNDLILYGSSELAMLEIPAHPAHFFADGSHGFLVNSVGRGSCQSLIHALSIAASGDSLTGKKVALITSPQSYVEQGIAPDMFMANFSQQQYLELLNAEDLSDDLKREISGRVAMLLEKYETLERETSVDPAVRWLAESLTGKRESFPLVDAALPSYCALSRYLLELKDKTQSAALLRDLPKTPAATANDPAAATSNNEFGMLNDFYTTNVGSRQERFKDRDAGLSYSVSEEYGDLRLLFEVCRQKGIEPLFIHVPMHGEWSDYVGFSSERRQEYYENVRKTAEEYGINTLDLTPYEYEEYFLCDVMHLGWKGWEEVDRALITYYYEA